MKVPGKEEEAAGTGEGLVQKAACWEWMFLFFSLRSDDDCVLVAVCLLNLTLVLVVTWYICVSALTAAAAWGQLSVCRMLLDQGAAPEQGNRQGVTPLFSAVRGGHSQVTLRASTASG